MGGLLAAFIHVASELTFILNSTRLLPPGEKGNAAHPVLESPAAEDGTQKLSASAHN